ncbi:hypothetical protein [Pseudovibrio sp. SPO723]|uniref:hypothetical protein n=1 Tax=Nesiotobacter zosterae TaxID=392721 RepID=UPI0029C28609|nr:hypothetical protein [Pseudovibrio sp. SPO723]MDX5592299.1 hypothetical protein [Pseudovibrio sp. SPO723]
MSLIDAGFDSGFINVGLASIPGGNGRLKTFEDGFDSRDRVWTGTTGSVDQFYSKDAIDKGIDQSNIAYVTVDFDFYEYGKTYGNGLDITIFGGPANFEESFRLGTFSYTRTDRDGSGSGENYSWDRKLLDSNIDIDGSGGSEVWADRDQKYHYSIKLDRDFFSPDTIYTALDDPFYMALRYNKGSNNNGKDAAWGLDDLEVNVFTYADRSDLNAANAVGRIQGSNITQREFSSYHELFDQIDVRLATLQGNADAFISTLDDKAFKYSNYKAGHDALINNLKVTFDNWTNSFEQWQTKVWDQADDQHDGNKGDADAAAFLTLVSSLTSIGTSLMSGNVLSLAGAIESTAAASLRMRKEGLGDNGVDPDTIQRIEHLERIEDVFEIGKRVIEDLEGSGADTRNLKVSLNKAFDEYTDLANSIALRAHIEAVADRKTHFDPGLVEDLGFDVYNMTYFEQGWIGNTDREFITWHVRGERNNDFNGTDFNFDRFTVREVIHSIDSTDVAENLNWQRGQGLGDVEGSFWNYNVDQIDFHNYSTGFLADFV